MNYLGHHQVARQVSKEAEPAFLFGSMAPDFIGMLRLSRRTYKHNNGSNIADAGVREGVRFHYRTNSVFDELEPIKHLQAAMIASFKVFMPRWVAVQCGRVGKDILFDSYVARDVQAVKSYQQTMAAAASGRIIVAGLTDRPSELAIGINAIEQAGLPDYTNPSVVAGRLHRRLTGTSTQFDADLLPRLSEAMAVHQTTVLEIGSVVMNELTDRLAY